VQVKNRMTFQEFAIQLDAVSVSGTYGLTNDWDANVLVPILRTSLSVDAKTQNFTHYLDTDTTVPDPAFPIGLHDSATGVGDVLLRTKYRVLRGGAFDLATGFVLRLPTGSEGDFHGLGDWTVEPLMVLSRSFGQQDVHASVGMDVNAGKIERSRVRYGLGVTLEPVDTIALLIDFIGSSGVAADDFTQNGSAVPLSTFDGPFQTKTAVAAANGSVHFTSSVPRTDIVDVAVGLKFNLFGRLVGFAEGIIPLNGDGLRADVVPTGGIEYTF